MKRVIVLVIAVILFCSLAYCAPVDTKDASTDAKSAFGVAFDEIVVDTSLTVKRKNPNRQSRNQEATIGGQSASVSLQKKTRK